MTNTSLRLTLTALSTLFASTALAAETASEAGASTEIQSVRHDGVFARLTLGPSAIATAIESDRLGTLEADGNGLALGLQVGGAIIRNLAWHVDLMAMGTTDGLSFEGDSSFAADTIAMGGIGFGLTQYFGDDWSVSGTALLSASRLDSTDGEKLDADWGGTLKLGLAKEWQAGNDWNLGVGVDVFGGYGRGDDESGADFHAMYFGGTINFVATYF